MVSGCTLGSSPPLLSRSLLLFLCSEQYFVRSVVTSPLYLSILMCEFGSILLLLLCNRIL